MYAAICLRRADHAGSLSDPTGFVAVGEWRQRNTPVSTNTVIRAANGSGASRMAAVSEAKRRIVGIAAALGDKCRPPQWRFIVSGARGDDVLVLLMPEVAVDVTPLQQFLVSADVVHTALFQNQNGVRRYEG